MPRRRGRGQRAIRGSRGGATVPSPGRVNGEEVETVEVSEKERAKLSTHTTCPLAAPIEQRWESDAGHYVHKKFKKIASCPSDISGTITGPTSTSSGVHPTSARAVHPTSAAATSTTTSSSFPLKHSALSLVSSARRHSPPPPPVPAAAAAPVPVPVPRVARPEVGVVRPALRHVDCCVFCGALLSDMSALDAHLRSHVMHFPYPCLACNFAFRAQSSLIRHCSTRAHLLKVEHGIDARASDILVQLGDTLHLELEHRQVHQRQQQQQHVGHGEGAGQHQPTVVALNSDPASHIGRHNGQVQHPHPGPLPHHLSTNLSSKASLPSSSLSVMLPGATASTSSASTSSGWPQGPLLPPQTGPTDLSSKTSGETVKHIDNLISENQAILETYDPLWPRRYMRKEEKVQTPIKMKTQCNGKESLNAANCVGNNGRSSLVLFRDGLANTATTIATTTTSATTAWPIATTSSSELLQTASSVKELWLNSCKQSGHTSTLMSESVLKDSLSVFHPSNPEGSVIKEILIKAGLSPAQTATSRVAATTSGSETRTRLVQCHSCSTLLSTTEMLAHKLVCQGRRSLGLKSDDGSGHLGLLAKRRRLDEATTTTTTSTTTKSLSMSSSVPGVPVPSFAGVLKSSVLLGHNASPPLFSLPGARPKSSSSSSLTTTMTTTTIALPSATRRPCIPEIRVVSPPTPTTSSSSSTTSSTSRSLLRPTSLGLSGDAFRPKRHVMSVGPGSGHTLVSPETPRPRKSYGLQYQNGTAYTYLGLKVSTRVYYCSTFRPQPMYVCQKPKLSMYSNWKVVTVDNHPSGLSARQSLDAYPFLRSGKGRGLDTMAESNFKHLIITPSSRKMEKSVSKMVKEEGKEKSNEIRVGGIVGGYKTSEDDDYTYVRGRGRGRYVCNACGIRCKKPSMLKKHIRTHTNFRPYTCNFCNFAFKTKGNLTKHMKSKAHHKKCSELGVDPNISVANVTSNGRDNDSDLRDDVVVVAGDSDSEEEAEEDEEEEEDSNALEMPSTYPYPNMLKTGEVRTSVQVVLTVDKLKEHLSITENTSRVAQRLTQEHKPDNLPSEGGQAAIQALRQVSTIVAGKNNNGNKGNDKYFFMPVSTNSPNSTGAMNTEQKVKTSSARVAATAAAVYVQERAVVKAKRQLGFRKETNETDEASDAVDLSDKTEKKGSNRITASSATTSTTTTTATTTTTPATTTTMTTTATTSATTTTTSTSATSTTPAKLPGSLRETFAPANVTMNVKDLSAKTIIEMRQKSQPLGPSAASSSCSSYEFIVKNANGHWECTLCHKTFSKADEKNISVHCSVHKLRPYECKDCQLGFQKLGHLKKHKKSSTHLDRVRQNARFGVQSKDNPRPFSCPDCPKLFRKRGILQKHLRSKTHIMKLEQVGKLPIGTNAEMERLHVNRKKEINVADCDAALKSLQRIAERLMRDSSAMLRPSVAPVMSSFNSSKEDEEENEEEEDDTLDDDDIQEGVSLGPIEPHRRASFSSGLDDNKSTTDSDMELDSGQRPSSKSLVEAPKQEVVDEEEDEEVDVGGVDDNVELKNTTSSMHVISANINSFGLPSSKSLVPNNVVVANHVANNVLGPPNAVLSNMANKPGGCLESPLALTKASVAISSPLITCDLCGFRVASRDEFKLHLMSHAAARPFVCGHCDAGFVTQSQLEAHQSLHT